jgi:hypothetical protein
MAEKGIFSLRTASDLFGKLEHDFERVKKNPADSYAAFDFFVTAFHLKEWKYGHQKAFVPVLSQPDDAMWETCRQLANGSKHFEVNKNYKAVKHTKLKQGGFQANAFQGDAFQVGYLSVRLEAEAAQHLGRSSIRVDVLADKLVEFWRNRV